MTSLSTFFTKKASTRNGSSSKLERYLMETMFEKSLFSDLSLVFLHPSFPFAMRFNVHKSIMSQSPFLFKLLENMENLQQQSNTTDTVSISDKNTKDTPLAPPPPSPTRSTMDTGITSLTIDLAKALTHCGFILAPFQHIVRRKWQKTTSSTNNEKTAQGLQQNPLLSSHIRFVLQWMYCLDKPYLLNTMHDKDTLRILSVSVLLDVHDLTQACVIRYTTRQLSLHAIMRDLETICQLPRGHAAYLQLRDAALLLLFRQGPAHAATLADLPVDYMADVLSADPLFVSNEFERYSLLKHVLLAFMQSVGKITWTPQGPVDQDLKRLSGFVRPIMTTTTHINTMRPCITADTVRSRKRKRIPSQDLEKDDLISLQQRHHHKKQATAEYCYSRLSFTALVPFEKLVADASSGGVIDKATVLSYLLRTTVNYSNMTFEQLTTVRQDGIVDEGIVFRALWQREALERVLFPLTYHHHQQMQEARRRQSNVHTNSTVASSPDTTVATDEDEERHAALDEYFDVDGSDAEQAKRRKLLLGTPRFRFKSSVYISVPCQENGWKVEERQVIEEDLSHAFDESESDSDDGSIWSDSDIDDDEDGQVEDLKVANQNNAAAARQSLQRKKKARREGAGRKKKSIVPYKLFQKTFYSEAETILGISYRLQIEAQVMPRHRLVISEDEDDNDIAKEERELYGDQHDLNENIVVCRFELQRDMKQIALPPIPDVTVKKEKDANKKKSKPCIIPEQSPSQQRASPALPQPTRLDTANMQKTKIHYWIHCLNRHEGILENNHIDPEDRVLVAVTEQNERENGEPGEMEPGYVGQVLIEATDLMKKGLAIDATVALEIFGFQKV